MEKDIIDAIELSISLNKKLTEIYNTAKLYVSEEELKPLYDAIWHVVDAIESQSELAEKMPQIKISA